MKTEKLNALADEAGFEITPWGNESLPCVHQEGPIDVELKKFAELIVRECLQMADEFEIDVNRSGLVDRMKYHFGLDNK
jgi:hypothetical protein